MKKIYCDDCNTDTGVTTNNITDDVYCPKCDKLVMQIPRVEQFIRNGR